MQHSKKEKIIENFTEESLKKLFYLSLIGSLIYAILGYYFGYVKVYLVLLSLSVFSIFYIHFLAAPNIEPKYK